MKKLSHPDKSTKGHHVDNGVPFGVQNVDPFGAQYSKSLDLGQDSGVVSFDSSENPELDSLDDLDREKERKSASVCALTAKGPFFEDSSAASPPS